MLSADFVASVSYYTVWSCLAYVISVPIARIAMREINVPTKRALILIFASYTIAHTMAPHLNMNVLGHLALGINHPVDKRIELQPILDGVRAALALLIAVACYLSEIRGPPPAHVDLKGKYYLVTGANAGIGLEVVRQLVGMGATVYLGCRSKERAAAVLNYANTDAPKSGGKAVLPLLPLDLSSLASVHAFSSSFVNEVPILNGLILNAGIIPSTKYTTTKEGLELTFVSNHLGHFLLTQLLQSKLASSSLPSFPSRIVITSSSLHKTSTAVEASRMATQDTFSSMRTYAATKLANILYANKLRRIIHNDIKLYHQLLVTVLHPGNPFSSVTGNMPWYMRALEALFTPFLYLYRESCTAGAFCTVYAATSPFINKSPYIDKSVIHCPYLVDSEPAPTNPEAYNNAAGDKLWDLSMDLCMKVLGQDAFKLKSS